jgi:hypothetical protein
MDHALGRQFIKDIARGRSGARRLLLPLTLIEFIQHVTAGGGGWLWTSLRALNVSQLVEHVTGGLLLLPCFEFVEHVGHGYWIPRRLMT